MKEYAEISQGFVVGFHKRNDHRVPEFSGRFAVKIKDDDPTFPDIPANIGDEYANGQFISPTRPNPNLDPPPPTDRAIIEETLEIVKLILARVTPGPPPQAPVRPKPSRYDRCR